MTTYKIGTLIKGDKDPDTAIGELKSLGFECFSLMFWESIGTTDLAATAKRVAEQKMPISALSVYGNPLVNPDTAKSIEALIESAPLFDCPIVSCFAGRVPGTSVPDSIAAWRQLFEPLVEKAAALNVRIAFENCRLGDTWKNGKWNIAINPDAWQLMFEVFPTDTIGLEWEPCHQVEALADPIQQLEQWYAKIIHIHGKDSRIDHDLIRSHGLYGKRSWHTSCLPGFGDSNWQQIMQILKSRGYTGTIDIEGWNDAQWSGNKEIEGQTRALRYLKAFRNQCYQ